MPPRIFKLETCLFLLSSCSPSKPPHLGLFLQDGTKFIEMHKYEGFPERGDTEGIPVANTNDPVIIAWLNDVNLNYRYLVANCRLFDSPEADSKGCFQAGGGKGDDISTYLPPGTRNARNLLAVHEVEEWARIHPIMFNF